MEATITFPQINKMKMITLAQLIIQMMNKMKKWIKVLTSMKILYKRRRRKRKRRERERIAVVMKKI